MSAISNSASYGYFSGTADDVWVTEVGLGPTHSTDHGVTWGGPATLIDTKTSHALNDKDSLTADPTQNGLVYVAWDQLSLFPPSKQNDPVLGQSEGIPLARDLLNSRAGASAMLTYITTRPLTGLFELGETAWHETAFRTAVASLAKITGQSQRGA